MSDDLSLRLARVTLDSMVHFLDIGLPVMDGYELAGHLRRIPELANLRLIAVTGYARNPIAGAPRWWVFTGTW